MTREFFEREYISRGKNLRQLEADTGIPCRFLTRVAREHGITMTGQVGPAPGHLPGQDVTGTGSPAEPGGQSLGDIRRAAQDSPAGWLRLRRFQIAMTSPTIAAAAARLRICPSALSHQLRRLERDIGAKLYQPATSRRPWRPTRRGAALLTTLAQPGIQALAAAHAPQISSRAGSHYRDRMPISLGPDAAPTAGRQPVPRPGQPHPAGHPAHPANRRTAHHRPDRPARRLPGQHLRPPDQAEEIRPDHRRPQGRAVYYRLTQPELGTLLQAAGQLLATARQQATEENDKPARKTQPTNR